MSQLVKSWETENLTLELHDCEDHDELLLIDEGEEDEPGVVCISGPEELDEFQKVTEEAYKLMVKRKKARDEGGVEPTDEDAEREAEGDEEDEEEAAEEDEVAT